jgi:RNase H-like domain found in reverse transcriptase
MAAADIAKTAIWFAQRRPDFSAADGPYFQTSAVLLLLLGQPPHCQLDVRGASAAVFQLVQDNGLQVNPAKCVFAADSVDFLGHRVSAAGQNMWTPCRSYRCPQMLSSRSASSGYRRFLPCIAVTLLPLTDALRGSPKTLEVTPAMTAAVEQAKAALAAATGLAHPVPHAQIALVTDASGSHVGVVLQQQEGKAWRPLSFFCRNCRLRRAATLPSTES